MTHRGLVNQPRGLVPCWPVLLVAFLAVNWTSFRWLERNFCLFSALGTCNLVHLAWTAIIPAISSITHNFHSYSVIIHRIFSLDTRRMHLEHQSLHLKHPIKKPKNRFYMKKSGPIRGIFYSRWKKIEPFTSSILSKMFIISSKLLMLVISVLRSEACTAPIKYLGSTRLIVKTPSFSPQCSIRYSRCLRHVVFLSSRNGSTYDTPL